ncbi:MAG: sugar kinase [Dehalococcoidia bacterium]|nr:sugar kinase [Dehalococcoidia bacterium]
MIVTRTPTRISLGGGGTDIRSYSCRYGGFLVSAAINKYVYVTVNSRFEDSIRLSYSKTEIADSPDQIEHPIVREALRLLGLGCGLEIVSIADVPANTGLGSSGSFTVGLLNALHTFKRENVPAETLAEEASTILMDVLGEPIGKHDQYLAALGGITCLDIGQDGTVSASPLATSDGLVEELESSLQIFYTGMKRSASEVLGDESQAISQGRDGVTAALHTLKDIGRQVKEALETGNLHRFGELLDQHWQFKKRLSSRVSSDHIDRCYELATRNGALGGKILGAGGGGFFMFFCHNSDRARLRQAMTAEGLREMRFAIDFEGSKVLVNF